MYLGRGYRDPSGRNRRRESRSFRVRLSRETRGGAGARRGRRIIFLPSSGETIASREISRENSREFSRSERENCDGAFVTRGEGIRIAARYRVRGCAYSPVSIYAYTAGYVGAFLASLLDPPLSAPRNSIFFFLFFSFVSPTPPRARAFPRSIIVYANRHSAAG